MRKLSHIPTPFLCFCTEPFKYYVMYIQSLPVKLPNSGTSLHIIANAMCSLTIKVVDVKGMIAKKLTTLINEGSQYLDINLNDLNEGNYVLNAFSGDQFLKSIPFKKP